MRRNMQVTLLEYDMCKAMDENVFKCYGAHDQDGIQAQIWLKP